MTAFSRAPRLAAYQSAAAHGGVAAADPHGLILLLLNGSLERIAAARGCIQNRTFAEKARLLHRAVQIIDQLRCSLDLKSGNQIAGNLDALYDYMCNQLLKASVENDVKILDEVMRLLHEVRDAWEAIPKSSRTPAR